MKSFSKEWREEKWKDPVWSKVISAAILTIFGFIGTGVLLIWKAVDPNTFKSFVNPVMAFLTGTLSIPIWILLAGIILMAIIFLLGKELIKYVRQSHYKVSERNPAWDEKVGEYSFEALYKLLGNQRLRVQTNNMRISGIAPPEETLLEQFLATYDLFRKGVPYGEKMILRFMGEVEMNDGGYVPEVLAPKLMEYDLLVSSSLEHRVEGQGKVFTIVTYNISETGYKFYDCLMVVHPKIAQAIYRAG